LSSGALLPVRSWRRCALGEGGGEYNDKPATAL